MTKARLTPGRDGSPDDKDAAGFAGVLGLVRRMLPEGLIDDSAWERLAMRAGRLPASAADAMFGFECRLGEPEASADLLLTVPRDTPFAAALVRVGAAGDPKSVALARLLTELQQPCSPLGATVDLVALEYDVAGLRSFPAAGVFLRSAAESGHAEAGLLTRALALASDWHADMPERQGVERILAALPGGAAVRWAGAFPGRKQRAVRLLVRALGDDGAGFLSRIGWTGDAAAVEAMVSAFRDKGVDNHVLALDVAGGAVQPGLGVELSRPARGGAGWREALDLLARRGWCLPEKAAALGRATLCEPIYSPAGVWEFHCGLHHLKLAVHADTRAILARNADTVQAKGYIACVFRPVS